MRPVWLAVAVLVVTSAIAWGALVAAPPGAAAVRPGPWSADDPAMLTSLVLEPQNPGVPEDLSVARPARARRFRFLEGTVASVANRNHNPLNIKLGSGTRHYVAAGYATLSDIAPLDGGSFLRFRSPALGFKAAVELLRSRHYETLDLSGVFRRWTNDGFGAEILSGTRLDGRTPLRNLDDAQLTQLLGAMATAEGYRSATLSAEIADALAR